MTFSKKKKIIVIATFLFALIGFLADSIGIFDSVFGNSKSKEQEDNFAQEKNVSFRDNGTYIEGDNVTNIFTNDNPPDQNNQCIEILELLYTFSISTHQTHNVLSWDVGSENDTKIDWLTSGLESELSNPKVPELGHIFTGVCDGSSARVGKLQISFNGSPTHTILRKKKEPADWYIVLCGARAGVSIIELKSNTSSHEFCGFKDFFETNNLIVEGSVKTLQGEFGLAHQHTSYTLKYKDRIIPIVETTYWGGNAGCSTKIYFSPSNQFEPVFPPPSDF